MPQISSLSLHPACPESYEGQNRGLLLEYLVIHFRDMFGIPPAVISSDFRRVIEETMEMHFPRLRRSGARAIIEGRIPGLCSVMVAAPNGIQGKLNKTLQLLDLLETIHCKYMERDARRAGLALENAPMKKSVYVVGEDLDGPECVYRIMPKGTRKPGHWQCLNCAAVFRPGTVGVRSLDGPCPSCGHTTSPDAPVTENADDLVASTP